MTKYIKPFVYSLAAYIIITFVNSLLLILELVLSIAPLYIKFTDEVPLNEIVLIMIGLNFVISILSYVYVGIKLPKTNNIIFDIILILLPFILSCPWLVIMNCHISTAWDYLSFLFISSLGTLIISTYSSLFQYIAAIFPSICISIGYIIKHVKGRRVSKKNYI